MSMQVVTNNQNDNLAQELSNVVNIDNGIYGFQSLKSPFESNPLQNDSKTSPNSDKGNTHYTIVKDGSIPVGLLGSGLPSLWNRNSI